MKFSAVFVAVLAVLVLVAPFSALAVPEYYVRMVNIAHRHGARNPYSNVNQSIVCNGGLPCGALTPIGMEMLYNMGSFMHSRFTDTVNYVETPLVGTNYDPNTVYSRSTAVQRCLQSGAAFLSGLYPATSNFYPAIFTYNLTTDITMVTDSIPNVIMKRYVDLIGLREAMLPTVDAYFTWDVIKAMAAEAYIGGEENCLSEVTRFECIFDIHDIADAFEVDGRLAQSPTIAANMDGLHALWGAWYKYLFGYDRSRALDLEQGSSGQFLAAEMLKNIRAFVGGEQTTRIFHYSTHDTMMGPLGITIGDQGELTMRPKYGVTIWIELLQRVSDGSYHIRVQRGTPASTTPFAFQQQTIEQHCMDASGRDYIATNNICPVNDFMRYIEWSQYKPPTGYCVVNQTQYDMMGCPTLISQPVPHYCDLYRTMCPTSACGDGYVLNAANQKCYPVGSTASGVYQVRLAQVVHRHGARNPNLAYNQTFFCGVPSECSQLNKQGRAMLRAVGSHMRTRYNDASLVGSPFFASESYNRSLVYTRSTDFDRTIQSANAFLIGLFPDVDAFSPIVYQANKTVDFLLNTDPMPPVMGKRWLNSPYMEETLNPVVDAYFTWEELQAVAAEAHASGACSDYDERAECALDLYDIGMSFQATGRLADMPLLTAALDGVIAVDIAYYKYSFGYNASNALDAVQGSMGQNIAQTIIANMNAYQLQPSYKMFEYSTHDSLVAPLGVTLGDQSNETMLPPFGVTYSFELLQDTGDDSFHVRVLRGHPSETGTNTYAYVDDNFPMRCMDANNQVYLANNSVCKLADFVRLVDSMQPKEPEGYCQIPQNQYDNMDCPATFEDGRLVPYYCWIYRTACPSTGCGTGYFLGHDMQCYPNENTIPTTTTTTTTFSPAPAPDNDKPTVVSAAPMTARQIKNRNAALGILDGITTGITIGAGLSQA